MEWGLGYFVIVGSDKYAGKLPFVWCFLFFILQLLFSINLTAFAAYYSGKSIILDQVNGKNKSGKKYYIIIVKKSYFDYNEVHRYIVLNLSRIYIKSALSCNIMPLY
ncbi:MAG: hypothetical protein CVU90_14085 [Firmicutes bacterium HGW-Firmicutes-15]|nr:MAG: hypothetical protein CVU90_14085 [Firmicutes bacterium HGW-Firmicutes-15]